MLVFGLMVASCAWSSVVLASGFDGRDVVGRFAKQRAVFLQAQADLSEGRLDDARAKLSQLSGYPLQAHFEYLLLRKRIERSETPLSLLSEIQSYHKARNDKRAHRRLLGTLKGRLAKLKKWRDFNTLLSLENAPVHPCDDLYTRVHVGGLKKFDRAARVLWAEPHRHTANCDRAFETLIKAAGDVPTSALWQRTIALYVRGQYKKIESLLVFFGTRDRRIVQSWLDQKDTPGKLLKRESSLGNMRYHDKLVTHLMRRWSREDLPAASKFWLQSGASFGKRPAEVREAIGRYAVLAAKRDLPQAEQLLKSASTKIQGVRYWRVRQALLSGRWQQVLYALDQLTPGEQAQPRWRYWRARALHERGFNSAANKIYKELAGKFEYYGLLAADKLSATYRIVDSSPGVDHKLVTELSRDTRITRATEFFLADIGWEGRREWNLALQGAGEAKLLAASELALSVGWHDRAYASINKTPHRNALRYKFHMPHRQHVQNMAAVNSISEALVYAVMRRESAYIADVRSPVGAVGLMQLMPATAREVAKKIGIKVPQWKLINGEINIQLGTSYLNTVHRRFDDNSVLAAAAYNAGPHRVSKWLPDSTMAADIWIETIPFDETRSYVKAVLFNYAVLQWQLNDGEQIRLRQLMQEVPATQANN